MNLYSYVTSHAVRGACTCSKCCDAPENSEAHQPDDEHTVDVEFFKVSGNPDHDEMKKLVEDEFPELLDGEEHNYIELGAKLGDQGVAMMTIALGHIAGIWEALTPSRIMPFMTPHERKQLAGMGMISLQANGERLHART